MALEMFECEDCSREFVMASEEVAETDEMACPVCQGDILNEMQDVEDGDDKGRATTRR